jgi:hypothetical protein
MVNAFQSAFERARSRYPGGLWDTLSARQRVTAIWDEIRRYDAARTRQPTAEDENAAPGQHGGYNTGKTMEG